TPAPSQDRAEGPGDDADRLHLGLPRDIAAELELTVDTLVYREQFARDLTVAARLDGGSLAVETLSASLPGGSEVSLTGALTSALSDDAGPPRFQGRLEAASDNLRALLAWLDVDIDEIPADRLRKMALTSAVDLAPQQITLRDTDLRLDVSRITGGVALALRERPGLGVGLSIDKLNLDAYLPKQESPAASARPQAPAEGAGEPQAEGAQPEGQAAPEATAPAGLSVLDAFDANLDIRVGALTYQGLPLNGLRLDATLQQGGLVVREASLMDLAGSRASFAGSLANVARQPSFDGSLDVAVASLSRLAKALALPMEGQPPLESFTLSGAVNGTPELVRFDQRLAALGGSLRAAGKAELAAGAPLLDAAVEASHPDLTVLLREMLPGERIPAGLGPADLKGRVAASPQSVTVSALEGAVAGVDLSGDLALALGGERPRITADLKTGALPLAALAAPAAASGGQSTASGGGNRSGAGAERPRNTPASAGRWSSEPLDLSALRAIDAEVALQSAALLLDEARLDNAQLEAVLTAGVLDLKRFTATAFGGALSVTGKADARETAPGGLEVAAAVTAIEMDLKALLRDLADSDRVSGPLTVETSLNASGGSEAALVNSLNGSGKIDGTLTVAAKAEEQAGALILNILGQKVREVRGISDSTTLLFSAFAGAPSKVDGTFVVEDGVLTTTDTRVQGRNARALTAATVNLPTWTLDSQTDVFRDSDPETAYLTAKQRGDLDRPNVSIGGEPFRRRDDSSQSGGGDGSAPEDAPSAQQLEPEAAPQQQEPPKPEDILKEGLKNLLQGLGG
ncbi:MAG TPA: AsmA family protein, partial [Kiloniellaceae bacterium]|nr:AsmA family protein [Kiloniellaceae bacterium]